MVGLFDRFVPKFVKQYVKLSTVISEGFKKYKDEVERGLFPDEAHSFTIKEEELKKLKDLSAETKDGHKINLDCNLGVMEELGNVLESGSDGIGLFRTEFIYLNSDKLPSEDDQYRVYK
jgi:phosphotransferase system enzyme I (PtsI)